MGKYIYKLLGYHAVKEAEIKLDGITVLSGINGCGKSTLSRWLYYLINGSRDFDIFLLRDYKAKIDNLINRMRFACMDLGRFSQKSGLLEKGSLNTLLEVTEKMKQTRVHSYEQIEIVQDLFLQALYATENFLSEALTENLSEARKVRILNYLSVHNKQEDVRQSIENFVGQNNRLITQLTNQLVKNMNERPRSTYLKLIEKYFDIQHDFPLGIQLEEDEVNLLEDTHVSTLFNLQRAIYIDTPMAVEVEDTENIFWNDLREMMLDDKSGKNLSMGERKFLVRVKDLLNGETVLEEDDVFDEKSLRYISKDKKVNISLKDAATGFKAFSYLQRLLENGNLNQETLLMIDEPEAHLHPQWIVEFARLLVLLNKDLGLKIMIASHNPDMVAAIHDIAHKEGVLSDTRFYVAQPDEENPHQYVYKDLEHEIGEIFDSFNIALDRINIYGNGGMDL